MISNQLLSEVLGYEIYKVSLLNKDGVHINITGNTEKYTPNTTQHNIFELAHKCKDWAHNNNYILIITYFGAGKTKVDLSHRNLLPKIRIDNWETSSTEPEAIFKACEWILQNRSSK